MSQYKNVKPCVINISTKDRILVKIGPEETVELDDADATVLVKTGYLVKVESTKEVELQVAQDPEESEEAEVTEVTEEVAEPVGVVEAEVVAAEVVEAPARRGRPPANK